MPLFLLCLSYYIIARKNLKNTSIVIFLSALFKFSHVLSFCDYVVAIKAYVHCTGIMKITNVILSLLSFSGREINLDI